MRRHFILKNVLNSIFLLSFSLSAFAIEWDYLGAENWGHLDPSFETCETGVQQSPIDIRTKSSKKINKAPNLEYHYNLNAHILIEKQIDDISIRDVKGKSIMHTGHSLRVDVDLKGHDFVKFNNEVYQLLQFHFHSPSEHTINGKSFPLEIHFVHENEKGQFFVLGVFVAKGKANASLQELIDNAPAAKKESFQLKKPHLDLLQLIPQKSNYYAYDGSLTTPPCLEPLAWIVFEKPVYASADQIKALEKILGNNIRPIQPLGSRLVTNNIV